MDPYSLFYALGNIFWTLYSSYSLLAFSELSADHVIEDHMQEQHVTDHIIKDHNSQYYVITVDHIKEYSKR